MSQSRGRYAATLPSTTLTRATRTLLVPGHLNVPLSNNGSRPRSTASTHPAPTLSSASLSIRSLTNSGSRTTAARKNLKRSWTFMTSGSRNTATWLVICSRLPTCPTCPTHNAWNLTVGARLWSRNVLMWTGGGARSLAVPHGRRWWPCSRSLPQNIERHRMIKEKSIGYCYFCLLNNLLFNVSLDVIQLLGEVWDLMAFFFLFCSCC